MQGDLFRQKPNSGEPRLHHARRQPGKSDRGAALNRGLEHRRRLYLHRAHADGTAHGSQYDVPVPHALHGISPMVRIPYPCPRLAAMAIDGGAQESSTSLYIEKIEDVKALAGAVRYRPIKGEILDSILSGRTKPNEKLQSFWKRFNRHNYLIIGIESVPAIRRLEELVSIEGVDGVFLGPHDITCSMGIPEEYEHPDFIRTVCDIIKRCRKAGVGVGIQADSCGSQKQAFSRRGNEFYVPHRGCDQEMRNVMNSEFATLRPHLRRHLTAATDRTSRRSRASIKRRKS